MNNDTETRGVICELCPLSRSQGWRWDETGRDKRSWREGRVAIRALYSEVLEHGEICPSTVLFFRERAW